MEKVLLLLSGGFDSAVAGKILKDQGYDIYCVHFSYEPFTGKEPEHKAQKIAKYLKFKKPIIIRRYAIITSPFFIHHTLSFSNLQ